MATFKFILLPYLSYILLLIYSLDLLHSCRSTIWHSLYPINLTDILEIQTNLMVCRSSNYIMSQKEPHYFLFPFVCICCLAVIVIFTNQNVHTNYVFTYKHCISCNVFTLGYTPRATKARNSNFSLPSPDSEFSDVSF